MTLEGLSKLAESKKSTVVINKGTSPLALLGVAFIVMKIMGYITWSWWWVLAPFWIPFGIALLMLGCLLFFVLFSVRKINKECLNIVKKTQEEANKTSTTKKEEDVKAESREEVKKSSKKSKRKTTNGNDNNGTTTKSKGKNV